MGFVVVFVGGAWAADKPEGSIGSEYNSWVIDGSEVGELDSFKIVIGLEVEGIASEMSLPLGWHLIETLGGEIGLLIVLVTSGLEGGFEMFAGSEDSFLGIAKGVEYVETHAEFESSCQHHHQ